MSTHTVSFTEPELRHIIGAFRLVELDGSYYLNKDQWDARHQRIVRKIEAALTPPERRGG